MSKGSSRSSNVNKVIGELALIEAFTGAKITKLTHIPGVSNEWPDALSRLSAPEGKQVPAQLSKAHRARCGPRNPVFWLTTQPPVKRKIKPPLPPFPHPIPQGNLGVTPPPS